MFLNTIFFWVVLRYSFLGIYKIVISYIFLHSFGTIGVAYATTLTLLLFLILTFILSYKIYLMPWYFIKKDNYENQ